MNQKIVAPVKAKPLELSADTTTEDAFVRVISACLCHAQANLPAVLDGQIEGVHQMRVGFRRLRSGLKIFRPLVPREASEMLVEEIRWLNGFLGPARDWDVFLYEGLVPLFNYFPRKRSLHLFRAKAETIRQTHNRLLRDALVEPRYAVIGERFIAWLAERAWHNGASERQEKRLAESVARFATPLLEQDHRRVIKRGEAFARASPEQRHALRIRIKEIRYALDFFAGLYPSNTIKPYLASLAKLQDCLGVMNDISVAHRLLDEAGSGTASPTNAVDRTDDHRPKRFAHRSWNSAALLTLDAMANALAGRATDPGAILVRWAGATRIRTPRVAPFYGER
jgi:triphosphatase